MNDREESRQYLHLPLRIFFTSLVCFCFQTALGEVRGRDMVRSHLAADSQTIDVVKVHRQRSFRKTVPAGNYSGITSLGADRYAVVDDKAPDDGFAIFRIDIDTVSGKILDVVHEGYRSSGTSGRDMEAVAFFPPAGTVFVSGERDNSIMEYALDGRHTGRILSLPSDFASATQAYGLESLTYSAVTHRFWTTTESTLRQDGPQASATNGVRNRLRLQSFDDSLMPAEQYFYEMDKPEAHAEARLYAMGVSELCALDDGRLIVLEREFFVPKRLIGAWVRCKLFVVNPQSVHPGTTLDKVELVKFKTRLNLFNYGLANYEGLCVGPRLSDGSVVLIMVSDSQNRYRGVLKDRFRSIVIRP